MTSYKRGYILSGPPGTGKTSFANTSKPITRENLQEIWDQLVGINEDPVGAVISPFTEVYPTSAKDIAKILVEEV